MANEMLVILSLVLVILKIIKISHDIKNSRLTPKCCDYLI